MISFIKNHQSFLRPVKYMFGYYSKTMSLSLEKILVRNYIILHYNCTARSCAHKFTTKIQGNSYSDSITNDIQHFQCKLMVLHKSVSEQVINMKALVDVIEQLENNDYDLTQNLSVILINCCGKNMYNTPLEVRQELVRRVWNILKKRKFKLTIHHYHALLQTYIENSQTIDPDEFLKNMTVAPQYDTHSLLLKVLSNTGNCESALNFTSKMHEKGLPLTEDIYNTLVHAYAINGNEEGAKEVINSMHKTNIKPSTATYVQLLHAFAKNGNLDALIKGLKTMNVSLLHILEFIKLLSLSGHGDCIPEVLKFVQPLNKMEMHVVYLIVQLVQAEHSLDAYRIITHIPIENEFKNIKHSFAYLHIEELINLNSDPEILLKYINDYVREQHISDMWDKAVTYTLHKNNKTLAFALFKEMKRENVTVHSQYYETLLVNTLQNEGENNMYSIIRHMIELNVPIKSETFAAHVFPYISTTDPVTTIRKMCNNGIATKYIIAPFIKFLLDAQRAQEAVDVCHAFEKKIDCQIIIDSLILNYKVSNDIDICMYLLYELTYNGRGFTGMFLTQFVSQPWFGKDHLENLIKILKMTKQNGSVISRSDINYIQEKLFNANIGTDLENSISYLLGDITASKSTQNYNSGSLLHPEYMNKNQLESHLELLKNSNMNVRGTLRKLFILACKYNDKELVKKLIDEMISKNLQWTPGMKGLLFNFYIKNEMIAEGLSTFNEIQTLFPNFKIDNFKILHLAILLVKYNKINESFKLIEQCTCVNQKPSVITFCIELLNLIGTSEHSSYTQQMLELLIKKGYCMPKSTILTCLVNVPLVKGNTESAVDVFVDCVKQYNVAPAKQEIFTNLINEMTHSPLRGRQMLQKVYSLSKTVDGTKATVISLMIALAKCNKKNELRDICKTHHISADLLLNAFKFLKDDEIVISIGTMLDACGDLLQEQLPHICDLTLAIYNKMGDCKQAVELEKKMKAKGVIPTPTFQKIFDELLKSQKFPTSPCIELNTATSEKKIQQSEKIDVNVYN